MTTAFLAMFPRELHFIDFILSWAIRGTLVLVLAAVLTRCARRSSAAFRHRVWSLAFCALLILPFVSTALPKWPISVWLPESARPAAPGSNAAQDRPGTTAAAELHGAGPAEPDLPARSARTRAAAADSYAASTAAQATARPADAPVGKIPQPGESRPAPRGGSTFAAIAARLPSILNASIFIAWLLGAGLCLIGPFRGRRQMGRLLLSARRVADQRSLDLFNELCRRLNVAGRVGLMESDEASVPVVVGNRRSAVVLPAGFRDWPLLLRRQALIHELAHVKRNDVRWQTVARFTTALCWFQPLAWYGLRQMHLEREVACDDCVLMAGEQASEYAAHLVAVARRLRGIEQSWAIGMAGKSRLELRITSLLDPGRSHRPLGGPMKALLWGAALGGTALVAAAQPHPLANAAAAKPAASPPGMQAEVTDDRRSTDETLSFAGTVVDRGGRPVAHARISIFYPRKSPAAGNRVAARTDDRGRFAFSRNVNDFADATSRTPYTELLVVATKDGFGFDCGPAMNFETSGRIKAALSKRVQRLIEDASGRRSNVLRLAPDDLPIHGRILTRRGQPVAGAKVRIIGIWEGDAGSLDAWETAATGNAATFQSTWEQLCVLFEGYAGARTINWFDSSHPNRMFQFPQLHGDFRESVVPDVRTDAEGWFTLTGLGRDRIAEFLVIGPGVETKHRFLRSRRGEVIDLRVANHPGSPTEPVYPSEFALISDPTSVVEGRIADCETGQSLAAVRVQSVRSPFLHAISDKSGTYRLEGLPLGRNDLLIIPPAGSRHLPGGITVKLNSARDAVVRDVSLASGLLVRGRAIDARTQKPVQGIVEYFADERNPRLKKSDSLAKLGSWIHVTSRTDRNGRFELVADHGPGIIGISAGAPFLQGIGADRIDTPRDVTGKEVSFKTLPCTCVPQAMTLVEPIRPQPGDTELTVNLTLRSGTDLIGRVVSPQGEVLTDYFIYGLRPSIPWAHITGEQFDVLGYFPSETRRLIAYHPGRNLAGYRDLSGPPPEKLEIQLRPAGTLAGRIWDADQLPLGRVEIISAHRWMRGKSGNLAANERDDGILPFQGFGQPFTTDSEGRFELKGIIPGLKYTANVRGPRFFGDSLYMMPRGRVFTDVTIAPGETKQLGDLRIQEPPPTDVKLAARSRE